MGLEREQRLAEAVRDLIESYELMLNNFPPHGVVAGAFCGYFDQSVRDAKAALSYKEPSYVSRPNFNDDASINFGA